MLTDTKLDLEQEFLIFQEGLKIHESITELWVIKPITALITTLTLLTYVSSTTHSEHLFAQCLKSTQKGNISPKMNFKSGKNGFDL